MRSEKELFAALEKNQFRRRFRLKGDELSYYLDKGKEIIGSHARKFIQEWLAPQNPKDDGRQTPMRGHPVFVAQHATATYCRGCLSKWHHIPTDQPLSESEIDSIVKILLT
jgi:Domain of unknown function (DUF4186)